MLEDLLGEQSIPVESCLLKIRIKKLSSWSSRFGAS